MLIFLYPDCSGMVKTLELEHEQVERFRMTRRKIKMLIGILPHTVILSMFTISIITGRTILKVFEGQ